METLPDCGFDARGGTVVIVYDA